MEKFKEQLAEINRLILSYNLQAPARAIANATTFLERELELTSSRLLIHYQTDRQTALAPHPSRLEDRMSQALYRKWRPSQWDQVVGQEHVVQTLRNAVTGESRCACLPFRRSARNRQNDDGAPARQGSQLPEHRPGKRPCDECEHCKAVNQGRFLDLIEIDAASNTSVEDVRDLRDKINFSPNQGQYKVYIVDEVHMLSTAAFNALLKTLEEPPSHAIFILATTEIHKIPATVLSRCQRHEFRRIPITDIVTQLKKMAKAEDLKVEEDALTLVARQATGSLRDAISLARPACLRRRRAITLELARSLLGNSHQPDGAGAAGGDPGEGHGKRGWT